MIQQGTHAAEGIGLATPSRAWGSLADDREDARSAPAIEISRPLGVIVWDRWTCCANCEQRGVG